MKGYAHKLGLAFDTKANLGAGDERLALQFYVSAIDSTYLEVSVQTNDTRLFESQTGNAPIGTNLKIDRISPY
jgi:hypothetical protein